MTTRDPTERPDRPLDDVLTAVFDRLSHTLAGPDGRVHPEQLKPAANDPTEGLVPDDVLSDIETFDWFRPADWAGRDPASVSENELAAIPQPSSGGVEGDGLDFFRSGEAPNNFTNRHNPLYEARAAFIADIAPRIEDMFGVEASGVGYYRPPSASDAAAGGRSANSDHYSAGALDFYGDDEDLTALRNWLVDQPWVAFVRWQSESHTDHLHVSADIGWVAQNYFQGRNVPEMTPPSSTTPTESPREAPQTRTGVSGAGRPV